jgi:hypothetical protein
MVTTIDDIYCVPATVCRLILTDAIFMRRVTTNEDHRQKRENGWTLQQDFSHYQYCTVLNQWTKKIPVIGLLIHEEGIRRNNYPRVGTVPVPGTVLSTVQIQ